jgi:hypothetical protein
MRKSTKLVGTAALAFAGLIAVSGAAFTGTGVSDTAATTQFVGGTVSQAVTGATLTGITYGYANLADTNVNTIALTFDSATTADNLHVRVAPSGGGSGVGTFTCSPTSGGASNCTYTVATGGDGLLGYLGLTSLAVTVSLV